MPSGSGLPFPTSNNAPQPIPGGWGNPTGANTGGNSSSMPFPTMPSYGAPSYNVGSYGTGAGLAGLSSGFSTNDPGRTQNLYNYLGKAYGKGPGQLLGNMITQGLFDPKIAAAFLNAQAPGIARGEAGIQSSFADAGARFSSAAALGLGDFHSQVQLNQQQTLASLFENAQKEQLDLLSGVLPSIHQERADEGGFLGDILGGLEIAGGIGVDMFTGGLGGNSLIGSGFGQIAGANNVGGQGGAGGMGGPGNALTQALNAIMGKKNTAAGIDLTGMSAGGGGVATGAMNNTVAEIIRSMQTSGGSVLGGETLGLPTSMPGATNMDQSFPF